MVSPFDIVKHLGEKTDLEFDIREYNSWIINKIFINTKDTVFFAEMMNIYYHIDAKAQYDFYYYGLPKAKRFGKWEKKTSINNDAEQIMTKYNVNRRVAESYLKILSKTQLEQLQKQMNAGGK